MKQLYSKTLLCLLAFTFIFTGNAVAQVAGEFRSVASGNWNSLATWEMYNAGWVPATSFPNSITAIATVQAGHTLTMGGAATVKTLNLNGIVNTTSINLLTIYRTGSIIGGSNSAYINGPLAGEIIGAGVYKMMRFPVGKNGICRPVILEGTGTATAVKYTVEMFNAPPPVATLPTTLTSVSTIRYYTVAKAPSNQNNNLTVTLSYDVDDAVGTFSNSIKVALLRNGATGWTDFGGTLATPTTGVVRSTLTIANLPVYSIGTFAIGSNLVQPTISGNAGVAGAVLAYNDGTPKTVTADATGNYSFQVPLDWSGTITPTALGYTFTPASISLNNVVVNATAQNFSAISIFSDYRTFPNVFGDWNDPAMWEALNPATSLWEPAINYPVSVTGNVTIDNADLNINSPVSISGNLFNNGNLNLNATVTIANTGKLVNQGTLNNVAGGINVYGTYEHAQDGGMIGVYGNFEYTATNYYAGSKVMVTGVVSACS